MGWRAAVWLGVAVWLAACRPGPPQALGTLEWDRITLPATASEPIVVIAVAEGDVVAAGALLVRLDAARAEARRAAAVGEVRRLSGLLDLWQVPPPRSRLCWAHQKAARRRLKVFGE